MDKIKRALVSVSDKTGIVDFCRELDKQGIEILSTGGTAKLLSENGVAVIQVSDYTGFPEIMNGRVKTLQPKIHGGILADRSKENHLQEAKEMEIGLIDLVVVNLYPFESTIKKPNCTFDDAIENIDIGGPTMLRSSAKNCKFVTVLVDSSDYEKALSEISESGNTKLETRIELAKKTFNHTSRYDSLIANYLTEQSEEVIPQQFNSNLKLESVLRYGENPHQKAALYGNFFDVVKQLQGKELSFNNIADANAAISLIREFSKPTVAILKHMNPCGVGQADSIAEAYRRAFSTDTKSPFGGIVVANRTIDEEMAEEMAKIFMEVVIAPKFDKTALAILGKKKNLRLLEVDFSEFKINEFDIKKVVNGILIQENDFEIDKEEDWKIVTKAQPTAEQMSALRFAWKVVKHVKSNAIVYANDKRTIGIGAGQMSRVDAAKLGVMKAVDEKNPLGGSVLSSDAFFPFRDGIDEAVQNGVKAIIQPGGSIRDEEVIQAANEAGIAMIFTGKRHFRH
ncbi:MAG: bifunctional phosphoribosylaminoimidazolecarboxamide formyltransferase/IMP cyclohydrolase PurH [Calditrichaeota bacterium]|nr:MAG: bifunctional phosphoribosylaminoimidazolecarboxamide formyltransferase/IMP cyclohydrolase PurH [Calditrichota bacterium]